MTKNTVLPRVLVTLGEPAGIGPQLLVRAAQKNYPAELVFVGDKSLLLETAAHMQLPLTLTDVDYSQPPATQPPGSAKVHHIAFPNPVKAGQLDPENAPATLEILNLANRQALSGQAQAIVTAPVHKANLNSANADFMGHTEYFAQASGADYVVMMLASNDLRITLATTHIPLSAVNQAITESRLHKVLLTILHSFKIYGLDTPKIAVCGLNPHAGENGLLGEEDDRVVAPALEKLREQGHKIEGPFPADTLFRPGKRQTYDVFLAMYHDQGLPVVKALGFGECANVTLGLPYIRTSVDHGTALDIAAEYSASSASLEYAIDYAIDLASGKLPA